MEYEFVVSKLMQLSGKDEFDCENVLGYLFYEEEDSCEIAPIEQGDLVEMLIEARAINFSLLDGESLNGIAFQAALEANLSEMTNIKKLFVRFIGNDSLTLEKAQMGFTPIESSLQNSDACDVLLGVTVDPELNKNIVAIVAAE